MASTSGNIRTFHAAVESDAWLHDTLRQTKGRAVVADERSVGKESAAWSSTLLTLSSYMAAISSISGISGVEVGRVKMTRAWTGTVRRRVVATSGKDQQRQAFMDESYRPTTGADDSRTDRHRRRRRGLGGRRPPSSSWRPVFHRAGVWQRCDAASDRRLKTTLNRVWVVRTI